MQHEKDAPVQLRVIVCQLLEAIKESRAVGPKDVEAEIVAGCLTYGSVPVCPERLHAADDIAKRLRVFVCGDVPF